MDDKYSFFYEQAVKARNFHYDNFSKWQTFFYVAIGAVLVAYCTVTSGGDCCGCANSGDACKKQFLEILLSALGYMFSLIWLCSSKGYTYWWNAYMSKLKEVEELCFEEDPQCQNISDRSKSTLKVYGSLKFCVCDGLLSPTKGANFSTSRLANALAFISAWAWGIVLLFSFPKFPTLWESSPLLVILLLILTPYSLSLFFVSLLNIFFRSDLKGFETRGCLCGPIFANMLFAVPLVFFIAFVDPKSECADFWGWILVVFEIICLVSPFVLEKVRGYICRFFHS